MEIISNNNKFYQDDMKVMRKLLNSYAVADLRKNHEIKQLQNRIKQLSDIANEYLNNWEAEQSRGQMLETKIEEHQSEIRSLKTQISLLEGRRKQYEN